MSDLPKTTCSNCQDTFVRISLGYNNTSRKRYVDENNEPWMGRKCPTCAKEWNRNRMRKKRSK